MDVDVRTIRRVRRPIPRNEAIPRWSRTARAALGLITFALISVFASAAAMMVLSSPVPGITEVSPGPLPAVLFIATFMQILLILFYISFAAQNPRTDARMAWMAGIVLFPFATLPLYWWAHIWRAPYVADPGRDYLPPAWLEHGARE